MKSIEDPARSLIPRDFGVLCVDDVVAIYRCQIVIPHFVSNFAMFLPKSHYFCRFLLHFVAFIHRVPRSIIVARSDFSRCNLRHVRCAETSSDWARASRTHFVSSSSWESPQLETTIRFFLQSIKLATLKITREKEVSIFCFPRYSFLIPGLIFDFEFNFFWVTQKSCHNFCVQNQEVIVF